VSTFCPEGLALAPKGKQLNHWQAEKPLQTRMAVCRSCTFGQSASRFCSLVPLVRVGA